MLTALQDSSYGHHESLYTCVCKHFLLTKFHTQHNKAGTYQHQTGEANHYTDNYSVVLTAAITHESSLSLMISMLDRNLHLL